MHFSVICLHELRILELPGKSGQGLLLYDAVHRAPLSSHTEAAQRSSKATTPKVIHGDQDLDALVQPGSSHNTPGQFWASE